MMELDVRGEMCPYPAIKTRDALKTLKENSLVVITDHAPALSTVPWEGAKAGFLADIEDAGGGDWKITLVRSEAPLDSGAALERIQTQLRALGQED
jgi:TusA-related sulfurtransferase